MSGDSLPAEARKKIAMLLRDLHATEEQLQNLVRDHQVQLNPTETALHDRIKGLLNSEAEEQHIETRAAILDALPSHIALINPQGVILEVNESWRKFAVANALMGTNFGVGQNYLEVCETARGDCNEEALTVAAGIREVLKWNIPSFSLDYPCHSPNEKRWFRVIITPLHKGTHQGAIVAHTNITERKLAEQALQEREERLSAVLENLKEGLVISDMNGHLLNWNRTSLEMHGFNAGEDGRGQLTELIHVFELSTLEGAVLTVDQWPLPRVLQGEVLRDVELCIRRKDKPWKRIFSYNGNTMPDNSGKHLAFVTINDVTERKKTEEKLKTSFKEVSDLKAALDEHAIVAITDPKGKITYVNDKFCAISKYNREELMGKDHRIINSGFHSKEFIRDLWETIQSGRIWKGELKNKASDGSFYWVDTTIVPFLNDDGKPRQYVAIRADITDRKRTEEQLRDSFKEVIDLKAAMDEHAIVAITDPKGKITYVNDKFCAISKYSREELMGKDHRIINSGFHSKDFIRDLWATIQSGKIWKGELKNKASDGTYYWVDTTIVPFLNDYGRPRQYVAIRADITTRKRLESMAHDRIAALARSNNELEQFAYVATHDLQEPLRAVASCVQLLGKRYEGKLDERGLEFITHAVDGTKRMQTLINDLLEYSRVSFAKPFTTVDFSNALEGALANLAIAIKESSAEVTYDPLPKVTADPTQIGQLFQNLIGNALKFHAERPLKIHISAALNNQQWLFSVRDNGIGMEEQYFSRIFRVFQRLHTQKQYRGTGIGLAICKKVVDIHGGKIWVESTLGQGSTFFFTIPQTNILL